MSVGLDNAFWDELLERINNREVVPVIGPGAVTFGENDQLLYPWLAKRLPSELDPPLKDIDARDLRQVVDAQRATSQPVERIYWRLHEILEDPNLRPGDTLIKLSNIKGFRLFLTVPWRDFVLWDDDVLHFLLRLNEQLNVLSSLKEALYDKHFLVLGLSFDDWVLRFFVQVVKGRRLSELAGTQLFVAENLEPSEREKVVVFFDRLTKQIRILHIDPINFIAELYARWHAKHPPPPNGPNEMSKKAHREKHRAPGCIFVSYASPDLETAKYVVAQLQQAGCLVWFDQEQLVIGENWEEALREAVEDRSGLFLSLISGQTSARHDGYNIYERNLAARRRDKFADNVVFYLPMRIDDLEPLIPDNEPRGVKKIQGVRRPGGHLDADFVGHLRDLQRQYCQAHGLPMPPP